jgi:hypothetical protein
MIGLAVLLKIRVFYTWQEDLNSKKYDISLEYSANFTTMPNGCISLVQMG